jgi:hypothetical protein
LAKNGFFFAINNAVRILITIELLGLGSMQQTGE